MIFADALPHFKSFLRQANLSPRLADCAVAFVTAFLLRVGPMSASWARRFDPSRRHLANLTRSLAHIGYSRDLLACARAALFLLHRQASVPGTWVFAIDTTHRHSLTRFDENTTCCANHTSRRKGKSAKNKARRAKARSPRKSHTFVFGLLLTPGGLRLPYWLPYYTKDYAAQIDRPFRTEAQLAAQMIRDLEVPAGAAVVVVADTSFDAHDVHSACAARDFLWVSPINPERVLLGRKPRRRVTALTAELSERSFVPYRLEPDGGPHRWQKRVSANRAGPAWNNQRTYWVHRRVADVHSVGTVVLLYSKKDKPKAGATIEVDRLLMSNALTASTEQLVGWYDLRWQVELFFKEMKSELGLARYRVGQFGRVEGWVELSCVAFCYLEWWRARQLHGGGLGEQARQEWERTRAGRLRQLLRQQLEQAAVQRLYRWSRSRSGLRRLRRALKVASLTQDQTPETG